ncbi:hypothetical protein ACQUW5_08915 [Legionella sp. CNM-1927-20]
MQKLVKLLYLQSVYWLPDDMCYEDDFCMARRRYLTEDFRLRDNVCSLAD